jgi:putative thioredoxin
MSDGVSIRDVSEEEFEREVIEASRSRPVLVDFWAPWCQPCLMLAPILEQLAGHYAGRIALVKVDTDREPGLATRYSVRSLPTVKLFVDGAVAGEFSGLQPPARIAAFLDSHLPRPSDGRLGEAVRIAAIGRTGEAIVMLREALDSDPQNDRIHPQLAALLLDSGQPDEAGTILDLLPAGRQQDQDILALRARLRFARTASEAPDAETLAAAIAARPDDLESRYRLSAHLVQRGEFAAAMDQLLEVIRRDRTFGDDAGRKALVSIFTIMNNEGELVREYRALLSAALN